jgi:predicted Zn finger-like uncharacterized protein
MLKVECESCKAPYQIDERRVPPTGLKMRCPKCGYSFMVASPDAALRPAPGVADRPQAPPAPLPPPSPPPPPRRPPSAAPRAPLPSDFPAALGSLDEPDLPVVLADLPSARRPMSDLPTARQPTRADLPIARKPTVDQPAARQPDMADLPTAREPMADLPAAREPMADLPSARKPTVDLPSPKKPPPRPAPKAPTKDVDLPSVSAAQLPDAKRGPPNAPARAPAYPDLPSVAAHLPALTAPLPVIASHLPVPVASLPTTAAGLPVVARSFGEIDFPTTDFPPPMPPVDRDGPAISPVPHAGLGSFGEIELPRELPGMSPAVPSASRPGSDGAGEMPGAGPSRGSSGDFGDLELEEKPRPRARTSGTSPAAPDTSRSGGMTFGEVDFTSAPDGSSGSASSISVVAPFPRPDDTEASEPPGAAGQAAATAPVRVATAARAAPREAEALPASSRPMGTRLLLVAGVVAVIAGAALQLTPYGAYGYLWVADRVHAGDYELAASSTAVATEKALGADTYDAAKGAVDAAAAAHDHTPRAVALTAYAALVDAAATVRFGADTERASRAKQLLAELPSDDRAPYAAYRDVALAAQAAANDDLDRARRALDAAGARDPSPAAKIEAALLRGNVELAGHDAAAALVAFKSALELTSDARARFGLARAYDLLGDAANAKKEIDATLAASPNHPGALTLRARMKSAVTSEAQATRDVATVLDGPARAKAAPNELSRAFAVRAWLSLERGSASDARDAFVQAVKLDPRNTVALIGEGRLLLSEGRYTEALARFDTAVQIEPGSPEAVAGDAEAKLALDRMADAKQQLTEARVRFPKDLPILVLLGQVEQRLGNGDAAEADLRAAVAMVEPAKRDAVRPYVVLSELLSSRGRLPDAKAVLDDAKRTLPPSAALDRALGDVAEQQGEHELAIEEYRGAVAKDPRDVGAHFRLAVTLRRLRRFPEASTELDQVVAVDKDYPGLSLERGLLFEESGDVQKAIAEFQRALAKAPDDPDLQLRVGSAYVAVGLPDDGIPMLRKVLQARPKSAEAYHFLGRALMLKGPSQQVEAMRSLKYAVDMDPTRAEFHVYMAWAANEANPAQLELAHDEIDKGLALDKSNAEIYWQKGVLERMEGSVKDAIKDEKHALELRPARYEAHATLAECYTDNSDEGLAMAEWAKALAADGDAPAPDGGVRHPYWRYKYGKLLLEHGNAGAALSWLLPAATTMERSDQRPAWVAPLEFLTAEALSRAGRKGEAADHYQRFLDSAPVSSPDRAEALAALQRLSGPR